MTSNYNKVKNEGMEEFDKTEELVAVLDIIDEN